MRLGFSLQSGLGIGCVSPRMRRFAATSDESDKKLLINRLIDNQGASPCFVEQIKQHMSAVLPIAMLQQILGEHYTVITRHHIRDGFGSGLAEDNDYTSGFHEYGSMGNRVVLGEYIKDLKTKAWVKSEMLANAVVHELGHALSYALARQEALRLRRAHPKDKLFPDEVWKQIDFYERGVWDISASPLFRQAWQSDFDAISEAVKKPAAGENTQASFPYYLQSHVFDEIPYYRARQETFAEGVDVLLRGKQSWYNYENFTRYFSKSLQVIRSMFQERLGATLP